MATNIRTLLSKAKTVLLNDDEFFNKDVTGIKNLSDLKDIMSIRGRLVKTNEFSNIIEYRLVDSFYKFSLTIIN